jgi:hypothetical protein
VSVVNRIPGVFGQGVNLGLGGAIVDPGFFVPQLTPTPPPAGLPVDLRFALAQIPIANDGNVISSEYHNSLRTALLAMAQLLGAGAVAPAINVSYALQLAGGATGWVQTEAGVASGASVTDASGWMSLALPDGARIQSMQIFGKKSVTVKALTFNLQRYLLDDVSQTPESLITLDASGAAGTFAPADKIKAIVGLGPTRAQATLDDQQLIQNGKFKYIFRVQMTGATAAEPGAVQIHAILVACSLGGLSS